MSPFIVVVVLGAAVLHASWNAMLKHGTDRLWWMTTLCLSQGLISAAIVPFLPLPAGPSWPYIVASAAIHAVYQFLLVGTYEHGDFSQTYPIARGSAPMMVALGGFLLAGEHLSTTAILGVVTVSIGIIALAFHNRRFHMEAAPAALATGLSIAAYSVVDGLGGRLSGNAFAYIMWMGVIWSTGMLFTHVYMWGFANLVRRPVADMRNAVLGGAMALGGYATIVWAMTMSPMGPVSALRETSVVFGTIIARLFLAERPSRYRVGACILIAAGAACLAA